jgi:hypothetical protein
VEEKLKQLAEEDGAVHAAPPASGRHPAVPLLPLDAPDAPLDAAWGAEEPGSAVTKSLHPEVTRAETKEAPVEVAAFAGARAAEPRALTFGELLEATLRL